MVAVAVIFGGVVSCLAPFSGLLTALGESLNSFQIDSDWGWEDKSGTVVVRLYFNSKFSD